MCNRLVLKENLDDQKDVSGVTARADDRNCYRLEVLAVFEETVHRSSCVVEAEANRTGRELRFTSACF